MSRILRLELHWKEPRDPSLPSSIVMKVPGPQHAELSKQADMGGSEETEQNKALEISLKFLVTAHTVSKFLDIFWNL